MGKDISIKDEEKLKTHIGMLKCDNPYRISGNAEIAPLISYEVWSMENLLMNANMVFPQKQEIELKDNGKAIGDPKNDYGYIEITKAREALIYSLENLLKDYGWQNVLIVNGLSKQALAVLRTFFGRLKTEFDEFEKANPLEKLKKELDELRDKWFRPCATRRQQLSLGLMTCEIEGKLKQKGNIVGFLSSSCDGKRFFEILKEYYETKIDRDKSLKKDTKGGDIAGWYDKTNSGRLADFRNALAHTNEIQLAVNIDALVRSFNDAKYLLRYLRFIQGEDWFPNFVEYDFKLMKEEN